MNKVITMNVENILIDYINELGDKINDLTVTIEAEAEETPMNRTRINELRGILSRLHYRFTLISTEVLNARKSGRRLDCIQLLNDILTNHLSMSDNMLLMAITNPGLDGRI